MTSTKQGPPIQFRDARIENELLARGGNRNEVAKRDLARYYRVLAREFDMLSFSPAEWSLIADATISTAFPDALRLALAAPPADNLDAVIEACEAKGWEWRLDGRWVQDGPSSWRWETSALVRPPGWRDAPPENADEDGWFGLSDDSRGGPLVELLRETMAAALANQERGDAAREDEAAPTRARRALARVAG